MRTTAKRTAIKQTITLTALGIGLAVCAFGATAVHAATPTPAATVTAPAATKTAGPAATATKGAAPASTSTKAVGSGGAQATPPASASTLPRTGSGGATSGSAGVWLPAALLLVAGSAMFGVAVLAKRRIS